MAGSRPPSAPAWCSGLAAAETGATCTFKNDGRFHGLTVEHSDTSTLLDPAWTDYEQNGDSEALASKCALFFRTIFVPTLASALARVRAGDADASQAFADRVETRLRQRLAMQPTPLHSVVETIVLCKGGSGKSRATNVQAGVKSHPATFQPRMLRCTMAVRKTDGYRDTSKSAFTGCGQGVGYPRFADGLIPAVAPTFGCTGSCS
jgi:hypothetical protein